MSIMGGLGNNKVNGQGGRASGIVDGGGSRRSVMGAQGSTSRSTILGSRGTYIDGEVHASDGGRCHPSIRENHLSFLSVCVFLCVTYLFYFYVSTLTPLYVRSHNQQIFS